MSMEAPPSADFAPSTVEVLVPESVIALTSELPPSVTSELHLSETERSVTKDEDSEELFTLSECGVSDLGNRLFGVKEAQQAYTSFLCPLFARTPLPSFYLSDIICGSSQLADFCRRHPNLCALVGQFFIGPSPRTFIKIKPDQPAETWKDSGAPIRFVAWWLPREYIPKVLAWLPDSAFRCTPEECDDFPAALARHRAKAHGGKQMPPAISNTPPPSELRAEPAGTWPSFPCFPYLPTHPDAVVVGRESSGVPKPMSVPFVHTIKDLRHEHLPSLRALQQYGTHLLPEGLCVPSGSLKMFFHYPVFCMYSVLHMHLCYNYDEAWFRASRSVSLASAIAAVATQSPVAPDTYILEENEDKSLRLIQAWVEDRHISPAHAAWNSHRVSLVLPPTDVYVAAQAAGAARQSLSDYEQETHCGGLAWLPSEPSGAGVGGAVLDRGKYVVRRFLGRGNFGYGWMVQEITTGKWLFAKTPIDERTFLLIQSRRKKLGETAWLPAQVSWEAELFFLQRNMAVLNSVPGVVQIVSAGLMHVYVPLTGREANMFVIVSELAVHGNLDTYLADASQLNTTIASSAPTTSASTTVTFNNSNSTTVTCNKSNSTTVTCNSNSTTVTCNNSNSTTVTCNNSNSTTVTCNNSNSTTVTCNNSNSTSSNGCHSSCVGGIRDDAAHALPPLSSICSQPTVSGCTCPPLSPTPACRPRPRQRLPEREARLWFYSLVAAVRGLHARDICHRDIKVANLLVTAPHCVKLCDFGLAKNIDTATRLKRTTTMVGGHWPPELSCSQHSPAFKQFSPFDPFAMDCWALGVVLLSLLRPDTALSSLRSCAFPLQDCVSEFSPELQSLLGGLLHPDPSTRLSAEGAWKHPWHRAPLPLCPRPGLVPAAGALIAVMGPPGIGKGTLVTSLQQSRLCVHVSVGELLRAVRTSPATSRISNLVRTLEASGRGGQPQSFDWKDCVSTVLLKRAVAALRARAPGCAVVLDNFPKNRRTLRGVEEALQQRLDAVLYLCPGGDRQMLRDRLSRRGDRMHHPSYIQNRLSVYYDVLLPGVGEVLEATAGRSHTITVCSTTAPAQVLCDAMTVLSPLLPPRFSTSRIPSISDCLCEVGTSPLEGF